MQLQLDHLYTHREKLQRKHGEKKLFAIHGAGCIKEPKICFVFMNPTGKNVSAMKGRKGIRAPRLGTKNVRKIFYASRILSKKTFNKIQRIKADERTEKFAEMIYEEIAGKKVYITNLAKCTQIDARPLPDKVFKEYVELTKEEIAVLKPKNIITFGNQVSSILLGKPVKVSDYRKKEHEQIVIQGKSYNVYPIQYPVGQGMRNMPQAIEKIREIY